MRSKTRRRPRFRKVGLQSFSSPRRDVGTTLPGSRDASDLVPDVSSWLVQSHSESYPSMGPSRRTNAADANCYM